nr:reverse transcriptase domain-containing protein [Tanacetum cinerariifolium]
MRTRNSYFPNNSSATILRRRNKRRTPNVVKLEIHTIIEMADNRTIEELLQAPTKGYGEAIVIPEIIADHFEIKMNFLQLVQANPYHGFERENPHTHINNFKRITSTLKFRDVPNDEIKLMMFTYSLEGNARVWENASKSDDRIDKLVGQISTLVDIFAKKIITPASVKAVEESCVTCEEQYTELLEPILESHQVTQNDNNVISEVTGVEQSRETVEQHPANFEETHALYDLLYQSLAVEVEKVNTEIWLGVQQMMKGFDIGIQEKKAKLFNEWERFTSNEGESKRLPNYMHQPMPNPKDITDPTTAMNMALALMAKAFKLNYSTPTNNNQRISSNPRNRQIAQPGMNMGQDRQMQMVGGNGNQNQNGNGNPVAARAEGNAAGQNGNQIRCYNCRGVGHFARNCMVRPRRRDVAYLQTQLLIAQKEEAGIQLQVEEFDLMAAVSDLDEIEEVNANCILMGNLQQASTSGTQTDKAPIYDSDGSPDVSVPKDNKRGTSTNTKFVKQSILGNPPMLGETHALSKPVTSNSVPTPQEAKVMKNEKVIALGMFRINPFKTSREEKCMPNNGRASARTKPITVSQPTVITKKNVNSDSNGLSSTGIDNTKTRRTQPRSNTKNDWVP